MNRLPKYHVQSTYFLDVVHQSSERDDLPYGAVVSVEVGNNVISFENNLL